MKEFVYTSSPSRVVFGSGALNRVAEEIDLLGVSKVLVLSTSGQVKRAEHIVDLLGQRAVGLYSKAVMHVPLETANEALSESKRLGADCAVAIGGGSTIGLAKAIALKSTVADFPIIAIPSTYAGSEMTSIYGFTEGGVKTTGKDPRVLPRTVIYDPDLSLSLAFKLTLTSGMNAIAHAVEGLYAREGNPVMNLMAEEGIHVIASEFSRLKADPANLEARSSILYGAWLCGTVLGNVGMALHHKLCHTLGGAFNLSHAEVHTVMLPHSIAYNASVIPEAMVIMCRALDTGSPASCLQKLARENGAAISLRDLGLPETDLDRAADLAVAKPYWNPRPVERASIRELLQNAWEGLLPSSDY